MIGIPESVTDSSLEETSLDIFKELSISIEVDSPIFINNNLSSYCKGLWSKCKRLWTNKYIHTLWVSKWSAKIKLSENSKSNTISHITNLEKIFPDNELLKDKKSESNQWFFVFFLLFRYILPLIIVLWHLFTPDSVFINI